MPLATQLTIWLGNDIGVLARLCRDLSDAGVNLIENSEAWRIFLHGTDEERYAFRAKCDAAEAATAREHEDQFYASLLKFIAGEPHDIKPGTVGMEWAEIAKTLVRENPALAVPENKDVLLKEIRGW